MRNNRSRAAPSALVQQSGMSHQRIPPRRFNLALITILLLFFALHGLYNWAIPLGEGPDEPGHLAYVLFLVTEGRLPVQRAAPEANDVPGEGHQPPLAYLLAAPAVAWLPPDQHQLLLTANPRFVWAGGDEPGAFMRGSHELWPWPPLTAAWHLARAISGLCGAGAVLFTFLAARCLRPVDPAFAPLAAALVAFNPQLLFTTALVTNDALLAALGAALLWWCLKGTGDRGQGTGAALRWALVAGVIFGLALLTKQSALLLGPLILWGGWRASGGDWRRVAVVTLAWGFVALLVAGWWLLRNLLLYGDLFGLALFQSEFATQPFVWGDPAAWLGALSQLFGSLWARFGWLSLRPPTWMLWAYAGLCGAALVGWGRTSFHHRGTESTEENKRKGAWVGPLLALGMALVWTLAFVRTAGLVAWQGRMLFPAISAIGLLLAAGLLPRSPARLLAFGLLALAVFMPLAVIRPSYSWVALPPRVAQAELGTAVFVRYAASWEQGVALRGWRLDGVARAGAALPVTLTWNSLEPVPRPWTVFVHLVDAAGAIVAESNSQPRGAALPFPLWTPGDWIADTHTLLLPAGLAPGSYELRVGLYRPEKGGQRQKVWAEDGRALGDAALVGTVQVNR